MRFDVEACLVVFIVVSAHVDDRTFQDIFWSVWIGENEEGAHTGHLTIYRRRIAPHCHMRELPDYLEAARFRFLQWFFVPYPNSMWEHEHLSFYLYNCLSFGRTQDFFFFFFFFTCYTERDIAHFYSRCLVHHQVPVGHTRRAAVLPLPRRPSPKHEHLFLNAKLAL